MSKNKKEKLLDSLFGGDMSPDLSSHHVQESGGHHNKNTQITDEKWQQSGNKVGTQPTTLSATKWQQTDNKVATRSSVKLETGNKVGTQPTTLSATKWQQTDNKVATSHHFSALVGLQRSIVIFLYENCKISLSRITTALALENISTSLETSSGSVKTTLQRLELKKIIKRIEFKNGRGGWSRYELSEEVYRDLLQHDTGNKLATKWQQTDNKVGTELATEPTTRSPYSSSNLLNITTTIEQPKNSSNLTMPVNLARFGISQNNLQKLIDDGLCSLELVQKSIEALSFDVEQGKSGNLASILFGVLRSGKEYISQKQAEELSKELEIELKRLKEIENNQKDLAETRLKARYKEFLEKTPNYLAEIKNRHNGLISENSELLEKIAFEEFKAAHINS